MAAEAEWIAVSVDDEDLERLEEKKGLHVRVLVSPYDVPEAIRGHYSEERKRFIVEFQYLNTDEESELRGPGDLISLRVGKYSERLYGIEIDVDSVEAETVVVELIEEKVDRALENLVRTAQKNPRKSNYRLARETLTKVREQLYSGLRVAQ